jgi:hypothetical protein
MSPRLVAARPLSLLAVLTDAEAFGPGMLSVLRHHFTLICRSARQALESAPGFAPRVILIDLALPGRSVLMQGLASPDETVFVALAPDAGGGRLPAGFQYVLPATATAGELEQLLGRIGQDLEADRPVACSS